MKITVLVKPNSKVEAVEKIGEEYKVYVNKPPHEGQANSRAIKLLADYFDIAASSVSLVRGSKSKKKIFEIEF